MAADIDIETAIAMFGHKRSTVTRSLIRVLKKLGFQIKPRLTRITPTRPAAPRSICKMRFRRRDNKGWIDNWHWVLIWDGKLYDPLGPDHVHPPGAQISSFIDLTCRIL